MARLTLHRAEWASVLREVQERSPDMVPPGLCARIEALLQETPEQWSGELCALELDPASVDLIMTLMGRHDEAPVSPEQTAQSASSVAAAVALISAYQHRADRPTYRIEHRTGGTTRIGARTSDGHARHAELSHHAARLIAEGATGELVLVEETTGAEVARRVLRPEGAPPDSLPPTHPQ
jgi:uncharacterized protein (DUF736 family)